MKYRFVIKRILIYFILIVLAFLLQTCLFPYLRFLWAVPNLLLIITFSYGLSYGRTTGTICGVFAGLMMDLFYSVPMGLFILILSYVGYFSGVFKDSYRTDSILLPVVICIASDVFYNIAMIVYRIMSVGAADIGFILLRVIAPEMFFTVLVTILIYQILLTANRRLDRMDNVRGQDAA